LGCGRLAECAIEEGGVKKRLVESFCGWGWGAVEEEVVDEKGDKEGDLNEGFREGGGERAMEESI
jgi:hypothetical protein